ncbi:hypothetical protein [Streptomyces sp. NPDC058954]|uniref:hypothetical protein n=1 Tax=Streptomyces sp. NPDC058954 TaxID=3346677 RepID=UPI0036842B2D
MAAVSLAVVDFEVRPDPARRDRLIEIRDNLIDRLAEAEQEGRLGEIEGLRISLTGAESKISQIARRPRQGRYSSACQHSDSPSAPARPLPIRPRAAAHAQSSDT